MHPRVIEEHEPELADHEVERTRSESVGLGIGDDELDVVDPRCRGPLGCHLRQWRGDIDADRRVGEASCREGESAAPAAHIEQGSIRCHPDLFEQRLGERCQLAVVAVGVVNVVH